MKMPHRTRGRIRAFCALAAIVAGAGAAAPAQAAPAATDWTSVSANTASGTVLGTSVSLSGTHVWDVPVSRVDGSWPYFAGPTFSPSLPKSDVIQISGAPGYSYTIRFGARVSDPVLELGSLGSRIDFPAGTPVAKVSGEGGFVVSGSSVSGTPSNTIGSSGNSDASGAIKLTGTYTSLTFKATPNYTGPEDGILVQLVTQPADPGGNPGTPGNPDQCANADMPITQANLVAAEDAIACLTNLERKKAGLAALTVNATLRGTARAHSQDMVQRKFDSHTNPDGKEPCDRILAAGYPTKCFFVAANNKNVCWTGRCGENIRWDTAATPNKIMDWWMTHPEPNDHRPAILNPQFKDLGVGAAAGNYLDGRGATVTQNFGSPA
jgi:uncharacterized protein YkwD